VTTYAGFEVLDLVEPDRRDGSEFEFLRPMEVLQNAPGRSSYLPDFDGARQGYSFEWVCTSREQVATLRSWIDTHRGARIPFWVPTYRHDLLLAESFDAGAEAFVIDHCRYTVQVFPQGQQRHHVCFYPPGSIPAVFHQVTAATDNTTTEQLAVSSPFAAGWSPGSTVISYLMLVRLAEDLVEIRHSGPEYARATIPVVELPQEVP
jgi:hypothetical protein